MDARSFAGGGSRDGSAWRSSPLPSKESPIQRRSEQPLGRDRRLRKTGEFAAVRRAGRSWVNELLVLRVASNEMGLSRMGFSISRRVGNAVVRNRVKRRLREIVRRRDIAGSLDVVITARVPAAQASYRELERAVEQLFKRARLPVPPEGQGPPETEVMR